MAADPHAGLGYAIATLNAALNGTCGALLLLGRAAIRRGDRAAHRRLMTAAFAVACVFLASYLTRFALTGAHRYPGHGAMKALYFSILGTHTLLAAPTPVLAILALRLALRGRFEAHRTLARITWPIWMYVSVTGVIVYVMLYHLA